MTVDDASFKAVEPFYEKDFKWDLDIPQEAIYAKAGLDRYCFAVSSGVQKHLQQEVKSEMFQSYQERTGGGSIEDGALAVTDAPKASCREFKMLGEKALAMNKSLALASKLRAEMLKQHGLCVCKDNADRVCLSWNFEHCSDIQMFQCLFSWLIHLCSTH